MANFNLHKVAKGLLGTFNLKTTGTNPPYFGEVLQPSTDVTELYTADLVAQAANTSTGEVASSSISLEVDGNHLWWVRNVSARWDFSVGFQTALTGQIRFSLQYLPHALGQQYYLATRTMLVTEFPARPLVESFSVFLFADFPRPKLLLPGSFLQMSCSASATAGSYNTSLRVDCAALPL